MWLLRAGTEVSEHVLCIDHRRRAVFYHDDLLFWQWLLLDVQDFLKDEIKFATDLLKFKEYVGRDAPDVKT